MRQDETRQTRRGNRLRLLAGKALANPLVTGGVLLATAATGIIAANALGNQSGRHPAPLFRTRAPEAPALPTTPAVRAERAAEPSVAVVPAKPKAVLPESPMVREAQALMRERGFYQGPVDGVLGPMTSDAIRALERQFGLTPTGEPTERFLSALRAAPKPLPLPMAKPGARAKPTPEPNVASAPAALAATVPVQPNPPGQVVVRTVPVPPSAAPQNLPGAAAPPPARTIAVRAAETAPPPPATLAEPQLGLADERLARVQKALTAMGYGDIPADGRLDRDTVDAIRRFELDRGLPVTGQAGDRVLLELIAMNALPGT